MTENHRSPDTGETAARIEWALGILSAAVVLALVGYLAYAALAPSSTLPQLRAEVVPAAPGEAAAHLRFVVRNDGSQTATSVAVAVVLRGSDGNIVGERRIVIDYLPGHSEATGGFVLPGGAEALSPELVVEGYLDP